MIRRPIACVWEITMGCNLRCGHCGSSCAEALPDELTTEEALDVADQIGELGLKWVTLSGGESLLREDWPEIAQRLREHGVRTTLISNGWRIDEEVVRKIADCRLSVTALSVDGTAAVHDRIRAPGSFDRIASAFERLDRANLSRRAITTVTAENLDNLYELKEKLVALQVPSWQIQLGIPMGNLRKRPDWLIRPEQADSLLDLCLAVSREGKIQIHLADCLGYFTRRETEIRKNTFGRRGEKSHWNGCHAGIRGFGILHNGDVVGCTSIREPDFVEGNLRTERLESIWNDPEKFSWRRKLTQRNLTGECRRCPYAFRCLGGCSTMRLALHGTVDSENEYCCYHVAVTENKKHGEIK